jgi:hypothetical protein
MIRLFSSYFLSFSRLLSLAFSLSPSRHPRSLTKQNSVSLAPLFSLQKWRTFCVSNKKEHHFPKSKHLRFFLFCTAPNVHESLSLKTSRTFLCRNHISLKNIQSRPSSSLSELRPNHMFHSMTHLANGDCCQRKVLCTKRYSASAFNLKII